MCGVIDETRQHAKESNREINAIKRMRWLFQFPNQWSRSSGVDGGDPLQSEGCGGASVQTCKVYHGKCAAELHRSIPDTLSTVCIAQMQMLRKMLVMWCAGGEVNWLYVGTDTIGWEDKSPKE